MLPVCKQIVVLLHQFIFVSCATNFFRLASAIGDFPAVHRIFQNQANQMCVKQGILPILPWDLTDTMGFQILCDAVYTDVRVNIGHK